MSEQNQIDWDKGQISEPTKIDWDKGQISPPQEKKEQSKGVIGHAQDAGVSLLKGVVSVPETLVGLADIPTGGRVGKFLEENTPIQFKQTKDIVNDWHTDQYKEQQRQFNEAGSDKDSLVDKVIDKGKVALSNPSMILNTVVESAPSMLAGGAAARGIGMAAKGVSPVVAGAVGEGAVMAGQQAEQIRNETNDKLLTPEQSALSVATGALGSLFGLAGGQVAKKMGFDDFETAMASGKLNSQLVGESIQQIPLKSIPKSIIGGALSEGLLEELPQSVSEQLLQNIALDKPLDDGLDSAIVMGALAGMAMGGGMNTVSAPVNYLQNKNAYDEPQAANIQGEQPQSNTDNLDKTESQPTSFNNATNPQNETSNIVTPQVAEQPVQSIPEVLQPGNSNSSYSEIPNSSNNPEFTEQLSPSQQMGINPEDGPLSSAAALAVDSGTSQTKQSTVGQPDAEWLQSGKQQAVSNEVTQFNDLIQSEYQPIEKNTAITPEYHAFDDIGAEFGEVNRTLVDWTKADAKQRVQWAKDAGLNPIQQKHVVNTTWPKLPEQLKEKITAVMPSSISEQSVQIESAETPAPVVDTQSIQPSFNQRIQEAHLNNPSIKPKLIQEEIALGRPRAEVLAEVSQAINEIGNVQASHKTEVNGAQSRVSDLEAQLATEKSVPKKLQIRKQLETLNAERTAIAEQNNLTPALETSSRADARNEPGTTSSFQMQPLDHGALNVPLSKRGNIDAQLDQYKKEQTALENEKRAIQKGNHADAQAIAKPMFDTLSTEQINAYANKAGIKLSEAKKELKSMAHWQPQKAVKVFEALKAVETKLDKPVTPPTLPNLGGVEQIQALEQQLAVEKSVPKKAQIRKQIAELQKHSPIDQAAHQAATSIQNDLPEPTQAQIEAGNYKKGHIKVHGLDIAIENPRGSERRGTDPDGNEWSHQMSDHYGYFKSSIGADNENIDTYVGRNPESDQVFIVDQMDQQTGGFDEHKVMLGFNSKDEAVKAYSSNFDKGWKVGPVHTMTKDEFKTWLKEGDTTKPAGESIQQFKIFTQIQSDSGLTHSIPGKLIDQVHKLGDVVGDLASMKTEGVKTNVMYDKQVLAKIAKLNPDVQVHIVSDFDNNSDPIIQSIADQLQEGGFYAIDSGVSYIYPKSSEWKGTLPELINHELIHAATQKHIDANKLTPEQLENLEELKEALWNNNRESVDDMDSDVLDRINYAMLTSYPHEMFTVFGAESDSREILNQLGILDKFDTLFDNVLKEAANDNGQIKQRSSGRADQEGASEGIPGDASGVPTTVSAVRAATGSSKNIKRSTANQQTSVSSTEENKVEPNSEQRKQNGNSRDNSNGNTKNVSESADGVAEEIRKGSAEIETDERIERNTQNKSRNLSRNESSQNIIEGSNLKSESTEETKQNNKQDKKRFSRTENSAASSTVAQVREALVSRFGEKTIADLEAQGVLNIVQYQQKGMTGNVEGWYENGKVTLVASNLDADSAVATFLHELGGHGGFQNLMNKDAYADLMRQFERMVELGNPVAVEAKRLAERELNKDVQLDEYLPYMITLASQMQLKNVVQKGAIKRFMDRIVSAVKAWLYDKGIKLNLNENDVLALAERMVEKQSGITAAQRVKQQLENTSAWMKAPNGNPTRLTEQQWLQVRTPAFKRWFGDWENNPAQASQAVDENGEPKIYYHGTAAEFSKFNRGGGLLGRGVYLTDDLATAKMYGDVKSNNNGIVMPLFVNTKQTMQATDRTSREQIDRASSSGRFDGIRRSFQDMDFLVAFNSNQVKHAMNNGGSFDDQNDDIRFSRQFNAQQTFDNIMNGIKGLNVQSTKNWAGNKWIDWLGLALSGLGRRQLTEIYSKILPSLSKYNELAAQMDADKNDAGAEADSIVREWSNLKDDNQLADLMHDATLAKIDPAKPHVAGDSIIKYKQLRDDFNALSPEAQDIYLKARDAYKKHYAKVHQAIKERILRSELSNTKKAELLKDMDNQFFGYVKGVYFPLARFGKYVVIVRNQNGQVESVSRAETMAEAQKARAEMIKKFPLWKVDRVILDKEFNASRDGVGRGFMSSLFSEVDNLGLSTAEQAEFEDTLSQLYLSSMPDLSWAKHGIHRKGTAGFSQDARRAFAQNMFHGAGYLAKLRYGDQMAEQLDEMQKYATEQAKTNPEYDQPKAQRVIDEMNKRHENLMNPKSHPLSSMLTSVGFIYYLGLSPAAAMVNLSQTPLVAYPIMGAKWGFDNAAKELLKASNDFRKGVEFHKVKWEGTKTDLYKAVSSDISKFLNKDEQQAYKDAVDRGVIDVTQAHDLAGIAQGEDSGVMWKMRPIMRAASTMFHSAERFNREVTFIAAYRLSRQTGATHDTAFDQAVDATYKGHFDYSSGNRPRIMQGNVAKVLLLFKQFGQNMIYTLSRQTYQSIKGETEAERKEARRALGAVLGMHAAFAGVLGLPLVGFLLGAASWMGGDDDDPWDAEVALRNYLAETFNPTISNLIMKGVPRAVTPIDMSGRVGINNLLLPDVQEGLEGKRWAESAMSAALGPVAGIGTNMVKGAQEISEGHNLRGVETMLPVFLKNFAKTYRYRDEGVQDKTGVSIMDEVSSMDLLVQGMGFSPSDVRTANEGKSAIYQANRKLNERRSSLMTLWSRAKMMDDQEEIDNIWEEIQGFNQKNPTRRITRMNLNQSYRNRKRRIDRAEDGVYLNRNQQGAREAGNFAFAE